MASGGQFIPAQLIGGVYDGDRGYISEVVPAVWVYECDHPRGQCPAGGIHWATEKVQVPDQFLDKTIRYDLDEESSPDAEGTHFYIYPEMVNPRSAIKHEDLVTV